MHGTH